MIVTRTFDNVAELNLFMQGGVQAGRQLPVTGPGHQKGVYRLNGKTLIFNSPASETVTFASTNGIDQEPMTWQQIKTQIETQTTGVVARLNNGRIELIEATPGSGVAIDETGTANALLGFDTSGDTIGALINSDGATAPFFVSMSHSSFSSNIVLLTEE